MVVIAKIFELVSVFEPNYVYAVFGLAAAVLAAGYLLYLYRFKPERTLLGIPIDKEFDLLKVRVVGPLIKKVLQWRGVHFALILPNLLIFVLIISIGLFGNPLGGLNLAITAVWILWFAVVEWSIFLGGRLWCMVCPLPALGEWISRRRIYSVLESKDWLSLDREWPGFLNNMWVPAIGFLGISLLIPWLVTRPVVTALLFLTLITLGLIIHLVFRGGYRAFCRHACPASGYIGHHSTASILSVRSKDESICEKHKEKECVKGNSEGYGCPWGLYPGGKDSEINCGRCWECLKSCTLDNMTVKLRMAGKEIADKVRAKADEAWMGFIRLTTVVFYMLAFFGPFYFLKKWGNMGVQLNANLPTVGALTPTLQGFTGWLTWAAIVVGISLFAFPALFYAFSWLSKKSAGTDDVGTKEVFLSYSNALTPFALLLWMSFGLVLLAVNWAYPIHSLLADPLGWGASWLGIDLPTAHAMWQPIAPVWLPYIQGVMTLVGFALSIGTTYRIGLNLFETDGKALKSTGVMTVLYTLAAAVFLGVLMGG